MEKEGEKQGSSPCVGMSIWAAPRRLFGRKAKSREGFVSFPIGDSRKRH